MTSRMKIRATLLATVMALLVAPAATQAYTVTVHVHGAGGVTESTPAHLMNCTVGPASKSESSVTDCVAGTPTGDYGYGWTVNLAAAVPTAATNRGWVFEKWVDANGSTKVDCDPAGTFGDNFSTSCQFGIFNNVDVDLYFNDVAGPTGLVIGAGSTPAGGSHTQSTTANMTFDATGDPDATFECKLDRPNLAGSFAACGGPSDKSEAYSGLDPSGTYTFSVRAKDPSGNYSSTLSRSWDVDRPTAAISSGPSGDAQHENASPSFSFTSSRPASFVCHLGAAAASPCSSGQSYPNLADGAYTFHVQAKDSASNLGAEDTRSFVIDRNPPTGLQTTGGPSGSTTSTDAQFDFSATDTSAVHYTCQLDTGAVTDPCSAPKSYSGLGDGDHTFKVIAVDQYGHASAPVTRTWTVDHQAPDTTILSGPAEGSSTPSADVSFTFASPESGGTFECKVDNDAFAPCTSPKGLSLANGDHTFSVRAKDAAGNADTTPATRSFRVNTLDGDSDGINRPADCDDTNPSIYPGATDTPGDGVDQDCSGSDATVITTPVGGPGTGTPVGPPTTPGGTGSQGEPVLTVAGTPSAKWKVKGAITSPAKLAFTGLTPGATVDMKCKAPKRKKGCPKATSLPVPASGNLDLTKLFKKSKLPKGTVVTITIHKQGMTTRVITFTTRSGKQPTVKQKP
jgi:hypothetical protein